MLAVNRLTIIRNFSPSNKKEYVEWIDAGKAIGKSEDEGIDGTIKADNPDAFYRQFSEFKNHYHLV